MDDLRPPQPPKVPRDLKPVDLAAYWRQLTAVEAICMQNMPEEVVASLIADDEPN